MRARELHDLGRRNGLTPEIEQAVRDLGFDPHLLKDDRSWNPSAAKGGTGLVSCLDAASWAVNSIDVLRAIGTRTFFVITEAQTNRLFQAWATALKARPERKEAAA